MVRLPWNSRPGEVETSDQEFKDSLGYKNPYLKREFHAMVHILVNVRLPSQVSKIHILSLLSASTRSKFYVREPVHAKPNWLNVGLTVGTTIFLWGYVSILLIGYLGDGVLDISELPAVTPENQIWVLCKQYMLFTTKPSLQPQIFI